MKKILFVALCALAMTSCTIYQYQGRDAAINRQDIKAAPTIVDVRADFTKHINTTSDWHLTKEDAMAECRYLAIMNNNIDLVVDPVYKIAYRPHKARKKYQAYMTGFAGYYANSRTVAGDIELLTKFTREQIENYLLMHNPEIMKYLYNNQEGDVITIYSDHNACPPRPEMAPAPCHPQDAPAPQASSKPKGK